MLNLSFLIIIIIILKNNNNWKRLEYYWIRKAVARGRTDHFITYLQFLMQYVCSQPTVTFCRLVTCMQSRKCFHVNFSGDLELWPMTLTFELDAYMVKMNRYAKYLGQRSFRSRVVVRRDRQTHTITDWLLYLDYKMIGNCMYGSTWQTEVI